MSTNAANFIIYKKYEITPRLPAKYISYMIALNKAHGLGENVGVSILTVIFLMIESRRIDRIELIFL